MFVKVTDKFQDTYYINIEKIISFVVKENNMDILFSNMKITINVTNPENEFVIGLIQSLIITKPVDLTESDTVQ